MVNAILMLAIKHPNREEIQDVTRDLFERYKDYVLGDYVWGLSSTDLHGNQVQTPPWALVLSYEQAIRKRAYALMVTDHLQFGKALEQAWKCPTTKERHFITPLALYSKRSYPQQNWGEWNPKGKEQRASRRAREMVLHRMAQRSVFVSIRANAATRSASSRMFAIDVSRRDPTP